MICRLVLYKRWALKFGSRDYMFVVMVAVIIMAFRMRSSLYHFIRWRNISTAKYNDELEPLIARLSQVVRSGTELSKIQGLSQLAYYLRDNPKSCKIAMDLRILPILLKLYNSKEEDIASLARWTLILLGYPFSNLTNGVRILSVDGGGVRYAVFY